MKPHEETWRARNSPACTEDVYKDTEPRGYVFLGLAALGQEGFAEAEARARLAAQAPAMARLLLDCQFVEMSDERGGYEQRCASCLNREVLPPDGLIGIPVKDHQPNHSPNCKLVALLRAAGVVD